MRGESASYAGYMLAKIVSPPDFGTVWRCRMLPRGGLSSQEASGCQCSSGDTPGAGVSVDGKDFRPSGPGVLGWICNGPKRRPNAFWLLSVKAWSRSPDFGGEFEIAVAGLRPTLRARCSDTLDDVGAADTKRVGDGLYRKASRGGKLDSEIAFLCARGRGPP
jgi:hypothetical protein